MPRWVQIAAELNPVRHFVAVSRAILVKGAGLGEVMVPMAKVIAFAGIVLPIAVRQYSKRTA
jgi:ABC-2 type transport system permease protein